MNQARTIAGYFQKAERALSGARLLLAANDAEGACNRAYFAMFDAAHAALLAANVDVPEASTKTHHGLIAAFGRYLVLGKHVESSFGGALNKVQRLRQLADYTGDPVSLEDATWAVEQAEAFVAAMRSKFMTPESWCLTANTGARAGGRQRSRAVSPIVVFYDFFPKTMPMPMACRVALQKAHPAA